MTGEEHSTGVVEGQGQGSEDRCGEADWATASVRESQGKSPEREPQRLKPGGGGLSQLRGSAGRGRVGGKAMI